MQNIQIQNEQKLRIDLINIKNNNMEEQGSISDAQDKNESSQTQVKENDKIKSIAILNFQNLAFSLLILMHLVALINEHQSADELLTKFNITKEIKFQMIIDDIKQWKDSHLHPSWWYIVSLSLIIAAYLYQPQTKLTARKNSTIIMQTEQDSSTPPSKQEKKSASRISRQENMLRIDTLLDKDIQNPPSPQQQQSPQMLDVNNHPAILLQVDDNEGPQKKDSSVTQISQIRQSLQVPVAKKHTSTKMILSSQYSSNSTFLAPTRLRKYSQSKFNPTKKQSQHQVFQFPRLLANQEKKSSKEISQHGSLSKAAQILKQRFINSHQKTAGKGILPAMAFKLLPRDTISAKHQQLLISDYDKSQNSECSVSRDESMLKITESIQNVNTDQSPNQINGFGSSSNPTRKEENSNNIQTTNNESSKSLFFQGNKKISNPKGSVLSSQLALQKPVTTTRLFRAESSLGTGAIPTNMSASLMPNVQIMKVGDGKQNKYGRNGHATQAIITQNNKDGISSSQNNGLNITDLYRKKIKKLEKQLNNTKIFLNMVIHDMRNPTNSIEFAIKQIIHVFNQSANNAQHIAKEQQQIAIKMSEQQLVQFQNSEKPPSIHNMGMGMIGTYSQQNLNKNWMTSAQNSNANQQIGEFVRQFTPTSPVNPQLQQLQALQLVSERFHEDEEDEKIENNSSAKRDNLMKEVEKSLANNESPKYSYACIQKNQIHLENDEGSIIGNVTPYPFKANQIMDQSQIEEAKSESSCNVLALERVLSYESMNVADEELLPVIQQVIVTDTKENGINVAITSEQNEETLVFRRFIDNHGSLNEEIVNDIVNHKTNFESSTFQNADRTIIRFQNDADPDEIQNVQVMSQDPLIGEEQDSGIDNQIQQTVNFNMVNLASITPQHNQQVPNQNFQQYLTVDNCRRSKTRGRDSIQRRGDKSNTNSFSPQNQDLSAHHPSMNNQSCLVNQEIQNQSNFQQKSSRRYDQTHLDPVPSREMIEETKNESGVSKKLSSFIQKQNINKGEKRSLNKRHLMVNTQNVPSQKPSIKSPLSLTNKGTILAGIQSSYNRNNSLSSNQNSQGNYKSLNSSERKNQQRVYLKPPHIDSGQQLNHLMFPLPHNAVLLTQEEKAKCESMLKNTLFSSSMLLNLINDLLDLAKIEKGQFNLNNTNFNLHEVIQKAIDTLSYLSQQKNIKMDYDYEYSKVGFFMGISGDDNRYLQILLNFLSNALKFTPNGGNIKVLLKLIDTQTKSNDSGKAIVGIDQISHLPTSQQQNVIKMPLKTKNTMLYRASQEKGQFLRKTQSLENLNFSNKQSVTSNVRKFKQDQENISGHIDVDELKQTVEDALKFNNKPVEKYIKFEIRIIDSGYGISKENIPKLFMNFGKLAEHADKNKQGTGLGLSICKSLIELMGGTVTVESQLGKGTQFIIAMQTKCQYPSQFQINKWLDNTHKVCYYKEQQSDGKLPRLAQQYLGLQSLSPNRLMSKDNNNQYPKLKQSQVVQQYVIPKIPQTPVFNQYQEEQKIMSNVQNSNFLALPLGKNQNNSMMKQKPQIFVEMAEESEENSQYHMQIDQNITFKIETFANSQSSQLINPNNMICNQQSSQINQSNNKARLMIPNISQDVFLINSFNCISPNAPQQHNIFKDFVYAHQSFKYRALIANDDPFQLQIISMMFVNFGFQLEFAENGLEAVQKYIESNKSPKMETHFDAIILDLDMPIMNGYEACQKIRKTNGHESIKELLRIETKKRIPNNTGAIIHKKTPVVCDTELIEEQNRVYIVALSGLITDNVIEKGTKCGFDDFIETPLTEAKIMDIIIDRLQKKDNLNLPSEQNSSSSDEQDQNEVEGGGFSSNIYLNPFLSISNNKIERNGTILNNQAFSAVDEEQSNMQDDAQSSMRMNSGLIDVESQHRYLNKKYMI